MVRVRGLISGGTNSLAVELSTQKKGKMAFTGARRRCKVRRDKPCGGAMEWYYQDAQKTHIRTQIQTFKICICTFMDINNTFRCSLL
jgi:hypothetical protein